MPQHGKMCRNDRAACLKSGPDYVPDLGRNAALGLSGQFFTGSKRAGVFPAGSGAVTLCV